MAVPHLYGQRSTLITVPIVNDFGFLNNSRDLNRIFPGTQCGSLASRLARLFMTEIVARSDPGITRHASASDTP